jgi:hypothetical protein
MQSKLTNLSLVNTFSNLNLLSSLDYKIKLAAWIDQAKRHIPDMTESDAQVYFATYRALLDDIDNQTSSFAQQQALSFRANKDLPLSDYQVDVRCFAIYIAL